MGLVSCVPYALWWDNAPHFDAYDMPKIAGVMRHERKRMPQGRGRDPCVLRCNPCPTGLLLGTECSPYAAERDIYRDNKICCQRSLQPGKPGTSPLSHGRPFIQFRYRHERDGEPLTLEQWRVACCTRITF